MINIVFALIVLLAAQEYFNRKERKRLIDAFLAKNLRELNEEPVKSKPGKPGAPEPVLVENLTDEEFDKVIKREVGREPVIEKLKRRVRGR